MRLRIEFYAEDKISLPLHYNHIIQRNIYELLDETYGGFLHDEGYKYEKRSFKLFAFSKLAVENKEILKDRIIIKEGKVSLTVSSIDERFIFSLTDGIISKRKFVFNEGQLNVKSLYARKEIKSSKMVALTISPVIVTATDELGKIYGVSAFDDNFIKLLKENLYKKYAAFYNEKFEGSIEIDYLDKGRIKRVVDFYKRYPYDAYLAGFIIKGDKDILDIAYSCGLGNKNSQGFGCIERIDEINSLENYLKVF